MIPSDRCPTCPNKYQCILSDGPANARVAAFGERPGQWEERNAHRGFTGYGSRHCFIGPTGEEFNDNYLWLAGLDRDEMYVGNVVKCGEDFNKKPGQKDLSCAYHFMPHELARVNPEIVILMGASACSFIPDLDLSTEHGIPRPVELFGWVGWVVPMYHPASGLHDSAMMIPMLEDWERLKPWLQTGEWQWAEDQFPSRDYKLVEKLSDWTEYFHSSEHDCLIAGDTETHAGVPYSVQISTKVGTARMVMLKDEGLVRDLGAWLTATMHPWGTSKLVFHNAPADLAIFEQVVGGKLNGEYRDTMQEAYRFGNLPQGLKALSRRILGRTRKSWDETVTPYSKEKLAEWMMNGFCHAEENWRITQQRVSEKTGKALKPTVKKSEAEKLLVEIMGYLQNNPEYKVWDKLAERMPVEELERLIVSVGPVPQKGIAHCPIPVQIEYGCSDPDDTLALAVEFDRRREQSITDLDIQQEDADGLIRRH